jgi:hypothetical protein
MTEMFYTKNNLKFNFNSCQEEVLSLLPFYFNFLNTNDKFFTELYSTIKDIYTKKGYVLRIDFLNTNEAIFFYFTAITFSLFNISTLNVLTLSYGKIHKNEFLENLNQFVDPLSDSDYKLRSKIIKIVTLLTDSYVDKKILILKNKFGFRSDTFLKLNTSYNTSFVNQYYTIYSKYPFYLTQNKLIGASILSLSKIYKNSYYQPNNTIFFIETLQKLSKTPYYFNAKKYKKLHSLIKVFYKIKHDKSFNTINFDLIYLEELENLSLIKDELSKLKSLVVRKPGEV